MRQDAGAGLSGVEELIAEDCRASFWRFVQVFWHTIPGSAPLVPNWHMPVICGALQDAAERVFLGLPKLEDILINISPGTSKSSICSILFHPWTWTRMPQMRHLCASHTAELALDLATKARAVITSPLYRKLFPNIELSDDTDTKGLYRNNYGGDRLSCTAAGKSPMGQHAHWHTIDDLMNPKKARSELEKLTAKRFMMEELPSRKVDKAVTVQVLVMQRLSVGDPTDVMLEAARREGAVPVRRFCMPAQQTDDVYPPEIIPYYEANGGLFDPKRLSRQVITRERAQMGAYAFDTQYLQRAHVQGGGRFRDTFFNQRCKAAPYKAKRIFYVDRASTQGGGCYTAGVLLAKCPEGNYYVEEVIHGQWEPDERNQRILAACLKYRRRYGPKYEPKIYVESEGGSSGRDAWKTLARVLAGFPVREDRVTGSKDVRSEGWATQLAAGNVYIVDNGESEGTGVATWDIDGFVTEHINFQPDVTVKRLGGFKDQVDACLPAGTKVVTDRGVLPIEQVRAGDMTPTLLGWRVILWAGQTAVSDTLVEVELSDGKVLTATPGHLVWTADRGYITIEALQPTDRLCVIDGERAWTNENGGRPQVSTSTWFGSTATPITCAKRTATTGDRVGRSRCIGPSTSPFTVLSPKAVTFITRTTTSGTTRSTIWNASLPPSIARSTLTPVVSRDKQNISPVSVKRLPHGTLPTPVASGIPTTRKRCGKRKYQSAASANTVAKCSTRWLKGLRTAAGSVLQGVSIGRGTRGRPVGRTSRNSARAVISSIKAGQEPSSARKPVPCTSAGTAPVYDLTVHEAHHFFADGVLVHNCTGAFNLLVGAGAAGQVLRRFDFGKRANFLRVIVATADDLQRAHIDRPVLLLLLGDATGDDEPVDVPPHALEKVVARGHARFADVDPAEVQNDWDSPLPGTDTTPSQVAMTKEQARRLWGLLLKRHDPPVEAVVICAETDDRRAISLAYAYCDVMRFPREQALYTVTESAERHEGKPPPNRYVYDMFKAGRAGM